MYTGIKQPKRRKRYESNVSKRRHPGTILGDRKRSAIRSKGGAPPEHTTCMTFCAILYVLKEGCAWRGLPHGFPKWNIVCHYCQIWSVAGKNGEASLFDRVLRELVVCGRVIHGREAKTTMAIMDFKRVKNADTAEKRI
ncbi:MAG: transposase [Treponema sp.]|nr:transposase [Treponema sp.]